MGSQIRALPRSDRARIDHAGRYPMRVLLVTGKGGVGKTTVAAATALACAAAGHRTAIMSTDPAHSLADAFDVELGDEFTEVRAGCVARQLDSQARLEANWSEIRDYLRSVFDWAGLDAVESEELAVIPGLDEIFALTDVADLVASGEHDVLVVDCAPTAETIRFLSLPDVAGWYMERLFPLGRRLTRIAGPVVSRLAGGLPIAGDAVFASTESLFRRLEAVRDILRDPEITSVRLVVNPEKMVVAEARRTHTYLSLFGYRVDAVVANRVLPVEVSDPWFDEWRSRQLEHLADIEASFSPLPIICVPLAPSEVYGLDALDALGAVLYGGADPAAAMSEGAHFTIEAEGDQLVLRMDLVGVTRTDVDLARVADELVITVGPYRRVMVLPDSLRRRPVTGASLADGRLAVSFARK